MGLMLMCNVKMMVRNRQTLFWALVFPLIFVVVFGLFDVGEPDSVNISIIDLAQSSLSKDIQNQIAEIELLDISREFANGQEAKKAVEEGGLQYALIIPKEVSEIDQSQSSSPPVPLTLYFNQANFEINQLIFGVIGQFANQVNLGLAQAPQRIILVPQVIQEKKVDYFDELIIGLVGMAIMFNSIVVIGVKISGYRQLRILRRILVTPLPLRNYFAAEILTHLVLALVQASIILSVGILIFGAEVHGNLLWVFVIAAFSSIVFLNIGFAIGGRASSPAAASGVANVIVLPMMFFSGTFFSTSSLPSFLPHLVKVLPLTPTIDALRAVAIDGQALWSTWPELAMLAGWIAVSGALASKIFRFS